MRFARAYLYGAHPQPLGTPSTATIELLQNDPLDVRDPENPLGYTQTPTDGDPLQYVHWYVFGSQTAPGEYAHVYEGSHPAWAHALDKLADDARLLELPLLDVEPAGRDAREDGREVPRRRRGGAAQHHRRAQHLFARARRLREPERDREALPELDHPARPRHRRLPCRPLPRGGLADGDALPKPRRSCRSASRTSWRTRSTCSHRILTS